MGSLGNGRARNRKVLIQCRSRYLGRYMSKFDIGHSRHSIYIIDRKGERIGLYKVKHFIEAMGFWKGKLRDRPL